jgi:uncharacterized protein (TIGR01777 family)
LIYLLIITKVVISGGTGFIGTNLAKHLISKGEEVTILTRGENKIDGNPGYIHWDPSVEKYNDGIEGADVVINLAGYSIAAKRWSTRVKNELVESRVKSTNYLVKSLERWNTKLFISASAVGYYGFRGDELVDETSSPGQDFLSSVAKKWEEAAKSVKEDYVSILRFGIVIGREGGILKRFLKPVKYGLSKKIGSGEQWISWVDIDDVIGAIDFIISNDLKGTYNVTSPNPLRNREFMKIISEEMGKRQHVSVPGILIKTLLGEMGESLILNGQRAVPRRLESEGYLFKYPELNHSIKKALSQD